MLDESGDNTGDAGDRYRGKDPEWSDRRTQREISQLVSGVQHRHRPVAGHALDIGDLERCPTQLLFDAEMHAHDMLPAMVEAPKTYSKRWASGARTDPPYVGDEREILVAYLDFHRATLEAKCVDVSPERLSERSIPPSSLTLHGLVRHLAGVERWWFRIQFAGEQIPLLYYSDDDPDQDFDRLDGDVSEAFAVWRRECEHSRDIVDRTPSLEQTGTVMANGQPVSLRRVLVNMIAEYARHNGHADLLRERTDGATGV